MTRSVTIQFLALLLIAGACAVAAEQGSSVRLGQLWAGQVVERELALPNSGENALRVTSVRTNCTCLRVTDYPRELAPGATGKVAVRLETADITGSFRYTVFVETADPGNPVVPLRLLGEVRPALLAQPAQVVFGDAQRGTAATRTLDLLAQTPGPVTVTSVTSSAGFLAAEVVATSDDLRQLTLEVRLTPDAPIGRLDETVRVQTDHEYHRVVTIRVTGNVSGPIRVAPPRLAFGPVSRDAVDLPGRTVHLRLREGADLRLETVAVTGAHSSAVIVAKRDVEPGRHVAIDVTVSPVGERGERHAEVVVRTNREWQREIVIPVNWRVY